MRTLSFATAISAALIASTQFGCDPQLEGEDGGVDGGSDAGGDAGDSADGGELDSGMPDGGSGQEISCTANAFVECFDGETARFCNATGDGYSDASCGAFGCNATEARCNACAPSTLACDGTSLVQCGPSGLVDSTESCVRACSPESDTPAHCEYLAPLYAVDVCDARSAAGDLNIAADTTLDVSLAETCHTLLPQSGGPELCVLRYRSASIASGATLTVRGARAVALVTDEELSIAGTLDVSADGTTDGPGGTRSSGGTATTSSGGGGGGFHQAGAAGGSAGASGGAGNGGAVFDPLANAALVGGGSASSSPATPASGGAGGAAYLVSCRGPVRIAGTVNAGGGGGGAGYDQVAGASISFVGGAGGGSGGQVVIEALEVELNGRFFANGGGGGSGSAGNDQAGAPGADGSASTTPAFGGTGSGGPGGGGGVQGTPPSVGGRPLTGGSPGGGGGGTGVFRYRVPDGAPASVTPVAASPALQGGEAITR